MKKNALRYPFLAKVLNLSKQPQTDYSQWLPAQRLASLLRLWEFSDVVDVGSHRGNWAAQFIPGLRLTGTSKLVMFDPLFTPTSSNLECLSRYVQVQIVQGGAGSSTGRKEINVASNDGESSSFLEFADAHLKAGPDVHYTGTRQVDVVRLDDAVDKLGREILLKLDVQGAEVDVLAGAEDLLPSVRVIIAEASLIPAYKGGSTLFSLAPYLENIGFDLVGLVESFSEKNWGRMIQMDAVFERRLTKFD